MVHYGLHFTLYVFICIPRKTDLVFNVDFFYPWIISCKWEAAQKTILSRRCFWASTFMILTTEIIKWLYESNGYDSLFMRRFDINRKPCRYLATVLVLPLLMWKKWKCCHCLFALVPFWSWKLLFSGFLRLFPSLIYYLHCLSSCASSSAHMCCFSALFQVNIVLSIYTFLFQNDYNLQTSGWFCCWNTADTDPTYETQPIENQSICWF